MKCSPLNCQSTFGNKNGKAKHFYIHSFPGCSPQLEKKEKTLTYLFIYLFISVLHFIEVNIFDTEICVSTFSKKINALEF